MQHGRRRQVFDVRLPELRPYAFEGNFGLERESLRVTEAGRMAQTPHPFPPDHPRIVRDFCENQTEINTGVSGSAAAAAKAAAEILAGKGVDAAVIDMHTIKPVDAEAIIKASKETGCIVTCEEHSIIGGLGSAVAEVLVENAPCPMLRVGVNDRFGRSGTPAELMAAYHLTGFDIAEKCKQAIALKG